MSEEKLSARAREVLKACSNPASVIAEMKLRHGNFISMHGARKQLYYEVSLSTSIVQYPLETYIFSLSTKLCLSMSSALHGLDDLLFRKRFPLVSVGRATWTLTLRKNTMVILRSIKIGRKSKMLPEIKYQ